MHLLTTPLITDADGTKFGKTEGNAVWLYADMTARTPSTSTGSTPRTPSVVALLKVFTDRTARRSPRSSRRGASEPSAREAQRTLAADVTTLVHGAAATARCEAASEALFGQGDAGRAGRSGRCATPRPELPGREVPVGMSVVDALVAAGLVDQPQRGPAGDRRGRRLVNNVKVGDAGRRARRRRPAARSGRRCCAAGASPWRRSPPSR